MEERSDSDESSSLSSSSTIPDSIEESSDESSCRFEPLILKLIKCNQSTQLEELIDTDEEEVVENQVYEEDARIDTGKKEDEDEANKENEMERKYAVQEKEGEMTQPTPEDEENGRQEGKDGKENEEEGEEDEENGSEGKDKEQEQEGGFSEQSEEDEENGSESKYKEQEDVFSKQSEEDEENGSESKYKEHEKYKENEQEDRLSQESEEEDEDEVEDAYELRISAALEDVLSKKRSIRAASNFHNVTYSTLHSRVKNGNVKKRAGRRKYLTEEEEKVYAAYCIFRAVRACPLSRDEILSAIKESLNKVSRKTKFQKNRPSKKWFNRFKKDHKLSLRKPEELDGGRTRVTHYIDIYFY